MHVLSSPLLTEPAALVELGPKGRKSLDWTGEVDECDTGGQKLIVAKEDDIRTYRSHRREKILLVAEQDIGTRHLSLHPCDAHALRLCWGVPLEHADMVISRNNDRELATLRGLRKDKGMTAMKAIKRAENHHRWSAHSAIIAGGLALRRLLTARLELDDVEALFIEHVEASVFRIDVERLKFTHLFSFEDVLP